MRTKGWVVLATVSVVAVVLTVASAVTGAATTTVRLTVVEHSTTNAVIDTGFPGDTTGDVLTFHNKLYKAGEVVGHDKGSCFWFVLQKSWECRWTNVFSEGAIMVEGPSFEPHDSLLAVTGGTGEFKNATGRMRLRQLGGGRGFEFSFILTLS